MKGGISISIDGSLMVHALYNFTRSRYFSHDQSLAPRTLIISLLAIQYFERSPSAAGLAERSLWQDPSSFQLESAVLLVKQGRVRAGIW
ncbi:MAG TPA: hypothetical protein DDY13_11750 [Cytophagales bacterium]|nr:hypothetical protein [Cytophagales bacterium]